VGNDDVVVLAPAHGDRPPRTDPLLLQRDHDDQNPARLLVDGSLQRLILGLLLVVLVENGRLPAPDDHADDEEGIRKADREHVLGEVLEPGAEFLDFGIGFHASSVSAPSSFIYFIKKEGNWNSISGFGNRPIFAVVPDDLGNTPPT
jgi:hypothetical protein